MMAISKQEEQNSVDSNSKWKISLSSFFRKWIMVAKTSFNNLQIQLSVGPFLLHCDLETQSKS